MLFPEIPGAKKVLSQAVAGASSAAELPMDSASVETNAVIESTPGDMLIALWAERRRIEAYLASDQILKSAGNRWPIQITLHSASGPEKKGPLPYAVGPNSLSKAGMLFVPSDQSDCVAELDLVRTFRADGLELSLDVASVSDPQALKARKTGQVPVSRRCDSSKESRCQKGIEFWARIQQDFRRKAKAYIFCCPMPRG